MNWQRFSNPTKTIFEVGNEDFGTLEIFSTLKRAQTFGEKFHPSFILEKPSGRSWFVTAQGLWQEVKHASAAELRPGDCVYVNRLSPGSFDKGAVKRTWPDHGRLTVTPFEVEGQAWPEQWVVRCEDLRGAGLLPGER
jgi:hypothetical protein